MTIVTSPMRALPALLAVAATVTAACLSVMAGWQRGGLLAERVLWIAVGVVLVIAAHLLPALCRPHGWRVRALGAALWIGCMAATCYGHAVFFLMAQKHAGELRATAVPVVTAHGRGLVEIADARADVMARLARITGRRCGDWCASTRAERAALTARLDALDVEAGEAKRLQGAQDRADAARATAATDPVTGAMTAFGVTTARADLFAGLAFAAVLEAVACFCWMLALRPAVVTEVAITAAPQGSHAAPVTAVTEAGNAAALRDEALADPVTALESPVSEQHDDVTRVMTAVGAGALRPTVIEIRKYLGCSQARAAAVRKQLEPQPITQ